MAADDKRVALVIGNSAYVNALPLKNPRNDAQAMSTVLARLGFDVISSIDLGRDAMEDKLVEFETAIGGASAAMLFYAGHGLQVKGHNYLIPVDADIRQEIQLKRRAFSLDELLDIMVRRARASLIFLDACRDNPFSRSLLSGMSEEEQKRYTIRSGLAEVKASQGSFIAFATAPDNVAHDGKGANSPFTEALVAHIEAPGVSVSDLMIEVRKDVLRATEGRQEPWDQSSLRERFCFKAPPVAEPVMPPQEPVKETLPPSEPAPFDPVQVELQWWERVKDRDNPALLTEFLQRYPQGAFAPLARDRLSELEWKRIKASRDAADFEAFIERWPGSRFETAARARLEALRRRAERNGGGIPWKMAAGVGAAAMVLVAGYTLWPAPDNPPPGPVVVEPQQSTAEERAQAEDDKAFAAAKSRGTKAAFEAYIEKYRRHADEAKAQLAALKAAERRGKVAVMVRTASGRDEEQWFKPGEGKTETFRDCINRSCTDSPEMVVVPAGSFMMGSPEDEKQRGRDESPQVKVTFRQPLAVGKFAVTRDEFEAFVTETSRKMDGGCWTWDGSNWKQNADRSWRSPGFTQSGSHPVVCVNWQDAQDYAEWLSKKTGKTYRLLSEAVREYVARAGTETPFWWGTSITPDQANYDGNYVYEGGGEKGKYREATMPVKSFRPNPWGLYQVHGNVWDWTQDCWNDSHKGASSDGSVRTTGDCSLRVLRGGSWVYLPRYLRAAVRIRIQPGIRYVRFGFRVSRTLNP